MASIFDFRERARARYAPRQDSGKFDKLMQILMMGMQGWQAIEGIKTQRAAREGMAAGPPLDTDRLKDIAGERREYQKGLFDLIGPGGYEYTPPPAILNKRAVAEQTGLRLHPEFSQMATPSLVSDLQTGRLKRPEPGPAPAGYSAWGDRLVKDVPSGPPPEGYTPWGGDLYKTGMTPGEREELALRGQDAAGGLDVPMLLKMADAAEESADRTLAVRYWWWNTRDAITAKDIPQQERMQAERERDELIGTHMATVMALLSGEVPQLGAEPGGEGEAPPQYEQPIGPPTPSFGDIARGQRYDVPVAAAQQWAGERNWESILAQMLRGAAPEASGLAGMLR